MNNKYIKKELKNSFVPPQPTRKEIFLSELNYPESKTEDIFYTQFKYIRKRFWIISFLIIIFVFFLVSKVENSISKILILSSFLPMLASLSINEINKTISYNMQELEMSCKYSLQKLTIIRMIILGIFHFILISFSLLIFINTTDFGILKTILYCLLPYLFVNYLSLFIINHIKIAENTYVCNGVMFFISVLVYMLNFSNINIFSNEFIFELLMVFIVIMILMIKEMLLFIKTMEEIECHLKLTV